jgi:hypothetical protein
MLQRRDIAAMYLMSPVRVDHPFSARQRYCRMNRIVISKNSTGVLCMVKDSRAFGKSASGYITLETPRGEKVPRRAKVWNAMLRFLSFRSLVKVSKGITSVGTWLYVHHSKVSNFGIATSMDRSSGGMFHLSLGMLGQCPTRKRLSLASQADLISCSRDRGSIRTPRKWIV